MSLWTVNDASSKDLMVSFYNYWLQGKTKKEAFRQAQFDLREQYPDPYNWGAFVMVGE